MTPFFFEHYESVEEWSHSRTRVLSDDPKAGPMRAPFEGGAVKKIGRSRCQCCNRRRFLRGNWLESVLIEGADNGINWLRKQGVFDACDARHWRTEFFLTLKIWHQTRSFFWRVLKLTVFISQQLKSLKHILITDIRSCGMNHRQQNKWYPQRCQIVRKTAVNCSTL